MPLFVHPHPYIQVRLHQVLPTLNPVAVYHPNQNHMNQRNLHHMIVHPAILCVIFSITTPIVHKIPPIKKGTKERIHSLSLIPLCTIIYPIKRTLVVMLRNFVTIHSFQGSPDFSTIPASLFFFSHNYFPSSLNPYFSLILHHFLLFSSFIFSRYVL